MKKTALSALVALTLSAALFTGCTAAAMSANGTDTANAAGVAPAGSPTSSVSAGIAGTDGSDTYIAQTDAENVALTDAGLTSDAVEALRSRLEYDDGRAVYDVEFWTATDEYDYDIDAVSGAILSKDKDAEAYTPTPAGTAAPTPSADAAYITEEAARQAALTHAGLTDDGSLQFFRTHLDQEDGRTVYEVEFCSGSTEYDYEIDALTGEVLAYDHDAEYGHHGEGNAYGAQNGSSNGLQNGTGSNCQAIPAEQAKEIALQYAGVSESDTTQMKVEFDQDDGRPEYDIEWEIGTTEYDCTVDACTGTVISFETDH